MMTIHWKSSDGCASGKTQRHVKGVGTGLHRCVVNHLSHAGEILGGFDHMALSDHWVALNPLDLQFSHIFPYMSHMFPYFPHET